MSNTAGMTMEMEILENERCWVGTGFGKGGLLPNDRGVYSTLDGSISWKTLDEIAQDFLFLGRGWRLLEEESFEPDDDAEGDGWMYATDFRAEAVASASPQKGMMHWVRFRKLHRVKVFSPDEFVLRAIHEQCDHCDSRSTVALAKNMLDALAYCTLLHSTTDLTDAVTLPLKKSIVDLVISQKPPDEASSENSAVRRMENLRKALENFVEKERSDTMMRRLLSGIDFSFFARHGRQEFMDRAEEVSQRFFLQQELEAIAGLVIRKIDTKHELHCDRRDCGTACKFVRVTCPNTGCTESMSHTYIKHHDKSCPYKTVLCECGDVFPLHEQPHHLSSVCPFREVKCPFEGMGCSKIIQACDIERHVSKDVASHLLLAVDRMTEYESAIRSLNSKVSKLETENEALTKALASSKEVSEKDIKQVLADLNKANQHVYKFEASHKKELRQIQNDLKELKKKPKQ